jgi:2-oxoglutarate ferredoxin oxidoreductase subunit alpha
MTETPLVIINSMRAGPSTGIPTKMEQADLKFMIHLSHGEGPRAIFAPRNIREAFNMTVKAFNIADRFQIPVIILSDFALSERTENLEPFDLDVKIHRGKIWDEPTKEFPKFNRYQLTLDGISPRAFPSTENAMHILVGAEHDEASHSLSGNQCGLPLSGELREKMIEKRFQKLKLLRQEMDAPDYYGVDEANFTILCWGSTEGAVKEAVDRLNSQQKASWNMLSFVDIFPLPHEKIKSLLEKINFGIMIEVNYTGQFEDLLHNYLDWRPHARIHPLSGETPTPSSIISQLNHILQSQGLFEKDSQPYVSSYYTDEGTTAR